MNSRKMAVVLQLLGIGWYVAICIGGGAFGGLLIDRQIESSPAFTLVGLGLGIVIAMIGMIRMLFAVLATGSDSETPRKR